MEEARPALGMRLPRRQIDDAGGDEPKKEAAKRGPKGKDKTETTSSAGDGFEIEFPDLKKKFAAWLGEFAKPEDKDAPDEAHPEVGARKTALKETLGKLKAKQLTDIENDAKKLTAINKWFEEKAKVLDHVGAGAGRFAKDPEADEGDSGDEGDLEL